MLYQLSYSPPRIILQQGYNNHPAFVTSQTHHTVRPFRVNGGWSWTPEADVYPTSGRSASQDWRNPPSPDPIPACINENGPRAAGRASSGPSAADRFDVRCNEAGSASRLAAAQAMISVTTPAPTVRPPSRMAKRRPASHAIGVISSINMLSMLSPGITISIPSGSVATPVTSVVRK